MSRTAATTLLALLLMTGQHVRAAETAVIYLACDGTMGPTGILGESSGEPSESVKKMGLIVNLADHTVLGFGVPAHIDVFDETHIEFSGRGTIDAVTRSVQGGIDRVTGGVSVWYTVRNDKKIISEEKDELACKVTSRLF
jgi:hypothetical protein